MAYVVTVRRRYGVCTDPTHDHSVEVSRKTFDLLGDVRGWIEHEFPDVDRKMLGGAGDVPALIGPTPDGATLHVAVAE